MRVSFNWAHGSGSIHVFQMSDFNTACFLLSLVPLYDQVIFQTGKVKLEGQECFPLGDGSLSALTHKVQAESLRRLTGFDFKDPQMRGSRGHKVADLF